MGAWDLYQSRMSARGVTVRDSHLIREIRTVNEKVPNSLSYTAVEIYPAEHCYNIESQSEYVIKQNVSILNSDNLEEKTMLSMPGEDIDLGALVHWMDNYWLVVERDANTTVYTKTKLLQCNHLLKWIDPEWNEIMEQWSVVEDGTKYLTGELEDWEQSTYIAIYKLNLSNCWNALRAY